MKPDTFVLECFSFVDNIKSWGTTISDGSGNTTEQLPLKIKI